MIKISQLKLPVGHTEEELRQRIRKKLKLKPGQEFSYRILRRSIDGRKKPEIAYVYTVGVTVPNEKAVCRKAAHPSISRVHEESYSCPKPGEIPLQDPPVVIGAGPAGLFCAYLLTLCGFAPIVLERGAAMEERTRIVRSFWEGGALDPGTNVQFGEGGAGTFSDGKLNSAVRDPMFRNAFVLDTFVKFGAPGQIRYDAKPHIGTDILSDVIVSMRRYLEERGCRFFFRTCVTDLLLENGAISGVVCGDGRQFRSRAVVLAPGHSARDTFRRLKELQITMEAKPFAVGFRVEHPQEMIDRALYGKQHKGLLPAAAYKLTSNFPNGRGVYSFCMCPGGYVVNASSEPGGLAVNGMSNSARNGKNANSAIIVSAGPNDFPGEDPLAGMRFQEDLERRAFALAAGKIPQQLYGDYCRGQASLSYGAFSTETKGAAALTNLRGLLSPEMEASFQAGMAHFSRILPEFDREDAILSGIESRTSSPLRILRGETLESSVRGLYPCGEGAGYAGGILSAAMDGLRAAEAVIRKYKPDY